MLKKNYSTSQCRRKIGFSLPTNIWFHRLRWAIIIGSRLRQWHIFQMQFTETYFETIAWKVQHRRQQQKQQQQWKPVWYWSSMRRNNTNLSLLVPRWNVCSVDTNEIFGGQVNCECNDWLHKNRPKIKRESVMEDSAVDVSAHDEEA